MCRVSRSLTHGWPNRGSGGARLLRPTRSAAAELFASRLFLSSAALGAPVLVLEANSPTRSRAADSQGELTARCAGHPGPPECTRTCCPSRGHPLPLYPGPCVCWGRLASPKAAPLATWPWRRLRPPHHLVGISGAF